MKEEPYVFTYTKEEFILMSRGSGFIQNSYEKVFRLCDFLIFVRNSKIKDYLVLKGGTAINLWLLDFPRLSVDADFDLSLNIGKEEINNLKDEIMKEINRFMLQNGCFLSRRSKRTYTLDSLAYAYTTFSGNRDVLKVEINYSNRCHVLPPIVSRSMASINEAAEVLRLSDNELIGSKISALITRTTGRDIFDVYNIFSSNLQLDEKLIKKIAIFYTCLSLDSPSLIYKTIDASIEKINKIDYGIMRQTIIPMLRVKERIDIDKIKSVVRSKINEMFSFNENENRFIKSLGNGIFDQGLLFEDCIVNDLKNHPMLLWKLKKWNEQNKS